MSDRILSVSSEATGEVQIVSSRSGKEVSQETGEVTWVSHTATLTLSREAVQELSDYLLGVLDQRDKNHEHDWQPYGVGERCSICLKVRQTRS